MLGPRAWRILKAAALVLLIVAAGIGAFAALQYYEPGKWEAVQKANNQGEAKAIDILSSERVAYYTKVLAIFTGVLSAFGLLQILFLIRTDETARRTADAARLNAEALIDAERAHLHAVITSSNLQEALRAAIWYPNSPEMDDGFISSRPNVEFVMKNLGRTPAILTEISFQLIQADQWQRSFQYKVGAIADPIIDAEEQLTPAMPCGLESAFTIGQSRQALNGGKPLYFYGYVFYKTSFRREYEYRWRFENRGVRWELTYYDEYQRGKDGSNRPPL